MATKTNDPGAEDVGDFLKRIKGELGDERDREDDERRRRLEEEIIQGRQERRARREGQLDVAIVFECLESSHWFSS